MGCVLWTDIEGDKSMSELLDKYDIGISSAFRLRS